MLVSVTGMTLYMVVSARARKYMVDSAHNIWLVSSLVMEDDEVY
jgi:hypothetical protein